MNDKSILKKLYADDQVFVDYPIVILCKDIRLLSNFQSSIKHGYVLEDMLPLEDFEIAKYYLGIKGDHIKIPRPEDYQRILKENSSITLEQVKSLLEITIDYQIIGQEVIKRDELLVEGKIYGGSDYYYRYIALLIANIQQIRTMFSEESLLEITEFILKRFIEADVPEFAEPR